MWCENIAKKAHADLEKIGNKADLAATDYDMIPKMIMTLKCVEKYHRHHIMPIGHRDATKEKIKEYLESVK